MSKIILFLFILFNAIQAQGLDTNIVQDVRGKNIFHFSINPKLPPFKFILIGDSTSNTIDKIKVYEGNDTIPIQELNIDDMDQPMKDREYFSEDDFNFDRYKDIMLLKYWGTSVNLIYKVWLFNPQKMRFESNDLLSYITSPEIDYNKKEIILHTTSGFDEFTDLTYKVIKGKFVLIKEVEQHWDEKLKSFIKKVSIRKNGIMQVIFNKKVKG